MEQDKTSQFRVEKNVIAGALIGSRGWDALGAGCESLPQSSKKGVRKELESLQKKIDESVVLGLKWSV